MSALATLTVTAAGKTKSVSVPGGVWDADVCNTGTAQICRNVSIPVNCMAVAIGGTSSITLGAVDASLGPAGIRILTIVDGNGTRTFALPSDSMLGIGFCDLGTWGTPSRWPVKVGDITAFTFTPFS